MIDRATALEAMRPFVLAELARRNFGDFCALDPRFQMAPHLEVIIQHLMALERRDIQGLMICCPPRHGKTTVASERFTAWVLGRRPTESVILASHSSELAEKNSRVVRSIVSDERYPFIGVKVADDSSAVNRWSTNAGGMCIAVSNLSSLTGFGGSLVCYDDMVRDAEAADSPLQAGRLDEWYHSTARPRLEPNGVELFVGTRWRDSDFLGRILNSKAGKRITLLSFPALAEEDDLLGRAPGEPLWKERFPRESLLEIKAVSGQRVWQSLYQQNPVPEGGGLFKSEWMKNFYDPDELPDRSKLGFVMTIDGAWKQGVTNDYSAISTWATDRQKFYCIDSWHGKLDYPDLKKKVLEKYAEQRPRGVYVEEAASGLALLAELRRSSNIPIVGLPARGSKLSRFEAVSPIFESQRVWLPRDAPWLPTWLNEHARVPGGAHDDMVDCTAMALTVLSRAIEANIGNYETSESLSRRWMNR